MGALLRSVSGGVNTPAVPLIMPGPERTKTLRAINLHLVSFKEVGDPEALPKAVSLMMSDPDFARVLGTNPQFARGITESNLSLVPWCYLYHHLALRDYVAAALILWGPDVFTPEPQSAQLMFDGLFKSIKINLMGAGSMGKTFVPSAWFLLDWLLDPEWTRVEVASNSEDHVKKNLFGDLVRLHSGAAITLPGTIDSGSISLDKKTGQGIFVLVIPGGPRARGKAKGAKCKPRPEHPLFGRWSRIRFLFDEAQEIAQTIFDEIPNLFSSIGEKEDQTEDVEHIKVAMAANPKDEWSRYGRNCKPKGGWENHDDNLSVWTSETGWHVIRLNAMKSENVIAKREIFPRLISWNGVQRIIQEAGSDQSPIVYSLVYGRFPPQGLQSVIIKPEWLRAAEKDWIFSSDTRALLGHDPAFTGDLPAVAGGRVGLAIGYRQYDGTRVDLDEPRMAIQVDSTGVFGRGDTQDLVDQLLARAQETRAEPEGVGIDRTGSGQGVYDIARRQWKAKVGPLKDSRDELAGLLGVHYSENASEVKIADEDTRTPKEMYDRVATELWYAMAKLFEFGCIALGKGVELTTFAELGARRGGIRVGAGKKLSVEGKDTYKARTGLPSPDRADSVSLLVHAGRMTTTGLIPKASDTKASEPPPRDPWGEVVVTDGQMEIRDYDGHMAIDSSRD